jgi:hypothetical protein
MVNIIACVKQITSRQRTLNAQRFSIETTRPLFSSAPLRDKEELPAYSEDARSLEPLRPGAQAQVWTLERSHLHTEPDGAAAVQSHWE